MAWMESVLQRDSWAGGYVRLVRQARGARPPGRQTGAALAAVERGEVGMAPAVCAQSHKVDWDYEQIAPWGYGVAVVRGGPHAAEARAFSKTFFGLFETPPPTLSTGCPVFDRRSPWFNPGRGPRGACRRLVGARCGQRSRSPDPMDDAGPSLAARFGGEASRRSECDANGRDTRRARIAPEPTMRAWLLRSWLSPPGSLTGL